jgi:hypothetical protein
MRLTEQASLTLFEVPDIDTHRAYSPTRLPSAIAKNGSGRRIYIPATVLPEVWDYIRFDRAVLIEQARRRGIYDRIPAKLLVEDPQYAAVAARSAGGRRRPVDLIRGSVGAYSFAAPRVWNPCARRGHPCPEPLYLQARHLPRLCGRASLSPGNPPAARRLDPAVAPLLAVLVSPAASGANSRAYASAHPSAS